MDTASIVTKTLFLSHKLSSLSTPLFIAHPLSTPLSPLFILLLSCSARWLYSPKVRSLYFGSRIVTLFSLRLFDCSCTQYCRRGWAVGGNMTTTLRQLWVSVGFLLFLTLLLIRSPSPFFVSLLVMYCVLCSRWWEKKKYINKNGMIEKGKKMRNKRDLVLQWRPWWEGLPVKGRQPASSNQMDVDVWWLSLSSRAFNGRAEPLTARLRGVPHFFHISVSLFQNWTINKWQIDFAPFQHEEWILALYLSP